MGCQVSLRPFKASSANQANSVQSHFLQGMLSVSVLLLDLQMVHLPMFLKTSSLGKQAEYWRRSAEARWDITRPSCSSHTSCHTMAVPLFPQACASDELHRHGSNLVGLLFYHSLSSLSVWDDTGGGWSWDRSTHLQISRGAWPPNVRKQVGVTSQLVNIDAVLLPVCQAPPNEGLEEEEKGEQPTLMRNSCCSPLLKLLTESIISLS